MYRVPLVKDMLVESLLRSKDHQGLDCLNPYNTLREVSLFMQAKKISSVLIMDLHQAMGIITERDLSKSIAKFENPAQLILSKAMTPWKQVNTISERATVGEADDVMEYIGVRHIPVVDEANKPVGMISQRDINNVYRKNDKLIATQGQ